MKIIVRLWLCWLGAFLLLPARGQSAADFLEQGWVMNHAVIPLYSEPGNSPAAIVRVDKVYTEYEKHGFFRIGALPIGVLEGVTFEAKDASPQGRNLERLASWLGADAGSHLELRGVRFIASPSSSLEAGRLRPTGRERWELSGGVAFVRGTNTLRADKATIQVTGPNAGLLILQTTPPSTNTFLFCNSTATPVAFSK